MEAHPAITSHPLARRAFILGSAAAVVAACTGDDDASTSSSDDGTAPESGGAGSAQPQASTLALRGVNYDTERGVWRPKFVRREIAAIRDDLHCNAILLLGSDLDRLMLSANVAAEHGLHVWFEPRHFDSNAADTVEFVSSVARAAEELRADHPDVALSLGVELTIFMDGILPGGDWSERGAALQWAKPREYNAKLNDFLAEALRTIRPIFGGKVTYSSGTWEEVDWSDFDVVGIDLYRDLQNEATFAQDVRDLHRHGKPVVITEFGCGSFEGADDLGGSGFMIVDWSQGPGRVAAGYKRDEQVQARYIDELLDIFVSEQVHGAFIYDFIEPDSPYSPKPRRDLDMAGYAVVKCYPPEHDRAYHLTGHFEPKAAFHTIAERFRS